MAWSLLRGHTCDAAHVRAGHCPTCGTTWTYTTDEWYLTKRALKGVDTRDENGERLPLI